MTRCTVQSLVAVYLVFAATIVQVRGGLQSDLFQILQAGGDGGKDFSCTDNPCDVNAECDDTTNIPEDDRCKCKKGYFGNGFVCFTTPCYSSPCLNGGWCEKSNQEEIPDQKFKCRCLAGFIGTECEKRVVPCFSIPPDQNEEGTETVKPKTHGHEYGTCEKDTCGEHKRSTNGAYSESQNINGPPPCTRPSERPTESQGCKDNRNQPICDVNANCVKHHAADHCKCKEGYFGNGFVCYRKCENDGKLICWRDGKGNIGSKCECLNGHDGSDDCSQMPNVTCKNRGVYDYFNNICTCNKNYDGVRCQEKKYQSYMHFPRVHFAGLFQADVPTANNKIVNFNILNFTADSAKQGGQGSWNPAGSGNFRLIDTRITRVCKKDGSCVGDQDKIISNPDEMVGAEVKDGDLRASAKMVDVDVEVEGDATEIWGLVIDVHGFFKGDFQHTSCRYIWNKLKGTESTPGESTKYQSVLTNVVFGPNVDKSHVAKELQEGLGLKRELSISFNLDLFSKTIGSQNFTYGRIVGSIGLSGRDSPPYFTYGRLLKPVDGVQDASFAPFTFEKQEGKIYIDLGNSLAIDGHGNVLKSVEQLTIGYLDKGTPHKNSMTCPWQNIKWMKEVNTNDHGGYLFTSGITVVQVESDDIKNLANCRLILGKPKTNNRKCDEVLLAEDETGINIQPYSRWVFRLQYMDSTTVNFWVTKFGEKLTDADKLSDDKLYINYSSSILDKDKGEQLPELDFPKKTTINCEISITIQAMNDPKNIRKYKDGQIYALEYHYRKDNDSVRVRNWMTAMNTAILVLVWNGFKVPDNINWITHIRPIFQQYANLYPVMKINFMDLGNYYDVKKHSERIRTTMVLPFDDPNFMPVTRDLSPCKTQMIVDWLKSEEKTFVAPAVPITDETLKNLLQIALQLEHATIPPYLSGYLSIKHGQNQEVKEILRKIVIDEMYHLAQVSNILNAIGGNPNLFKPDFVLPYPSYLPGGAHPNVMITIDKISYRQIQNVYMEIEKPFHELIKPVRTSRAKMNQDDCTVKKKELFADYRDAFTHHNTIGELYAAIIWVLYDLTNCGQNTSIFDRKKGEKVAQLAVKDRLVNVTKYEDALDGINLITEQGEGASPCNPFPKTNGTSGKDGNCADMSHYFAFASIVHKHFVLVDNPVVLREDKQDIPNKNCTGNFSYSGRDLPFHEGGVWPIVKDPKMSKYKIGSKAYKLSQQFNEVYSRLLHALQAVFNGNIKQFDDSMGLMKMLLVVGNQLVQTPIEDNGDAEVGPNAGPTYRNDN